AYHQTELGSQSTGGIIRAINSTFHNNRIDVRILNYQNTIPINGNSFDNQCFFKNCTFETTSLLNNVIFTPLYHAFILRSDGVKFYGCDFVNSQPDLFSEHQRGYGIFDMYSKLRVEPSCSGFTQNPCNNPDPSHFENLFYGIACIGSTTLHGLYVDRNEFINNNFGIYVSSN